MVRIPMTDTKAKFRQLIAKTIEGLTVDDTWLDHNVDMIYGDYENSYRQPALILSLPEAKKHIESPTSNYDDFVYIRQWNVVFFNVTRNTTHECFMGLLCNLFDCVNSGKFEEICADDLWVPNIRDKAEQFLSKHYGFFVSTASGYGKPRIKCSKSLVKTATERLIFKNYEFAGIVD